MTDRWTWFGKDYGMVGMTFLWSDFLQSFVQVIDDILMVLLLSRSAQIFPIPAAQSKELNGDELCRVSILCPMDCRRAGAKDIFVHFQATPHQSNSSIDNALRDTL